MKISAYPQDTAPTNDDYVITVDATTGSNRRVTMSAILALLASAPPTAIQRITGEISPYVGRSAPTDWLMCDGSAVSRTTYAALFAIICGTIGTATITNATPAVVTLSSHGLQTGDQVYLTTTGSLPTGLTANTLYYAVRIDANTFNLATSRANAYAATKIATSSAGSGTHTVNDCAYGLGDGSTTFNVPDLRGRTIAGNDSMGGTVASRLTLAQSQGVYGNKGANGGEQGHQITIAELASHTHTSISSQNVSSGAGFTVHALNAGSATALNNTGSDTAHNNVQPTLLTNFIIKT